MKFYTQDLVSNCMAGFQRHSSMRAARYYARHNLSDTRVLSARGWFDSNALHGVRYDKTVLSHREYDCPTYYDNY